MKYPAVFTSDALGGFVVTFRDIPEALTQGDTLEEGIEMAKDALLVAMDFYFEDKRLVPTPSEPEPGEHLIALPLSVAAKVLLLNEMVSQRVGASDLARRMATSPQEINRVIDLHHTTKIDRVEQAMIVLGKQLELYAIPEHDCMELA